MPTLKSPAPQGMRLSRDTLNILDAIARELGDISRRSAVELVCRFVRNVRDKRDISYEDLLIADSDEDYPAGA